MYKFSQYLILKHAAYAAQYKLLNSFTTTSQMFLQENAWPLNKARPVWKGGPFLWKGEGIHRVGGGGVAWVRTQCQTNGQSYKLPQKEWQLLPVKHTGYGELTICCCTEGHSIKKGGDQHTPEEVPHHEDVQAPPILQQIPVQESGHPLWLRKDVCKGASREGEGRYYLCPRCC